MERFRNLIFLILLGFLFVEVLIIFPAQLDPARESTAPAPPPSTDVGGADQKIEGVHLVESQKGSRDWELIAVKAEGHQGKGTWDLADVKVHFYNSEKVDFTVTGDAGTIDYKTKDMKIHGNVRTVSSNGYLFKTEEIVYDARHRKILSPGLVEMTGPADEDGAGLAVKGRRMLVEVESSRMTIQEEVTAQKELRGGRRLQLGSQSAEFSGRSKEARFRGQVVMRYDRMKVEGPETVFQYSGGKTASGLDAIQVLGGVKVSDDDKFATSERLNLDLISNKFIFNGRPKVYQNSDELSGERIIFLDGGKKVKVEGVRARLKDQSP